MLSSLFNVTDKNFAAVLWAPDDVIRQVEYGTSVLGIAAVFWLLQKHSYTADIYPSQLGQFQVGCQAHLSPEGDTPPPVSLSQIHGHPLTNRAAS